VIGNIGAFLDMLKKSDESIPYLQKAAELAPSDPINAWDLARAYDYSGQIQRADLGEQRLKTPYRIGKFPPNLR
jgi:tetratricopeptide (TPR) repeat protein